MNGVEYLTKAAYYTMGGAVLIYMCISIDSLLFDGQLYAFVSHVDSSIMVQNVDSKFKLEAYVGCLQTDSTLFSMQFKWII